MHRAGPLHDLSLAGPSRLPGVADLPGVLGAGVKEVLGVRVEPALQWPEQKWNRLPSCSEENAVCVGSTSMPQTGSFTTLEVCAGPGWRDWPCLHLTPDTPGG